jgi:hypothetical protein
MGDSGGQVLARIPGAAAGLQTSWTISASVTPPGAPTPGSGQTGTGHGVHVSEFSDATGTGNYVHEFVEIHFDGHRKP